MKAKIINIIKYLDGETKLFNADIKRYKILTVIIAFLILGLLQSHSFIKSRVDKYNNGIKTSVEKEIKNLKNVDYDDIYTYMSKDEVSHQVRSTYNLYKLDVENKLEENKTSKNVEKTQMSENYDKYMIALQDLLKSKSVKDTVGEENVDDIINKLNSAANVLTDIGKYTSGIKPSKNETFKVELISILSNINSKSDRVVSKFNEGFLVQKFPKQEQLLEKLFEHIVKYNYIIYVKNIPVGIITSKHDRLSIEILDVNTKTIKNLNNETFGAKDLLNIMPKGYPNMILIYNDGTIDVSDIILDVLKIDRLSNEAAPYTNMRVVESSVNNIKDIKKILNNYSIGM